MKTLSLIPHISEKAYQMSIFGTYIFDVPTDANKAEIARLVESKYEVSVITVNVLNRKGKKARSIRLGSKTQPIYGTRSRTKKAYVKLKKGETIQIEAFSEVQAQADQVDEPKKEKKAKQVKKISKK
jgi:large subunit ribosomal protein L23